MKSEQLHGIRLLMRLLTGDPVDAMEAAKEIISHEEAVAPVLLLEVAVNRKYKLWSRVAAVYSVGLLGFRRGGAALTELLAAHTESAVLRSHVAEALGNMGYSGAVEMLGDTLGSDRSKLVKKSCVYALSQIRSPRSKVLLERAQAENPKGEIAKDISVALERLGSGLSGQGGMVPPA